MAAPILVLIQVTMGMIESTCDLHFLEGFPLIVQPKIAVRIDSTLKTGLELPGGAGITQILIFQI